MGIRERYAGAIRSRDLHSDERTNRSDSDVLAAAAFASRGGAALGVALERMLAGDRHMARELVRILGEAAWGRARFLRVPLRRVEAKDLAADVVAWWAGPRCGTCGGHGFLPVGAELGSSRTVIGDAVCPACRGDGRRPLLVRVRRDLRPIAAWVAALIEAEQAGAAGAIAARLGV